MDVSNREGIFERTKEALQLLACPAEVQIRLLPSFVCVADELALEFSHWRGVLVGNFASELTPEQIASLTVIVEKLALFSRGGKSFKEGFWTDEALRESTDWENIRQLAIQALHRFGWSEESPPTQAHGFT
jgi:hypothetical protein